jgi:hypothetical protein
MRSCEKTGVAFPDAARVPLDGGSPGGDPLRGAEVDRLADVVPVREPGVVRARPGHDKLARLLQRLEHLDAVPVAQRRGRHERDQPVQQVGRGVQ